MENTKETIAPMLKSAKEDMVADMKEREIGAIIWDNSRAGFHFLPEIAITDEKGKNVTMRITGLYHFNGQLYAIEEDKAPVHLHDFFTQGVEVPPVVVTLSEDLARGELGDPTKEEGFTTAGTLEEWTAIADCYFEALNER